MNHFIYNLDQHKSINRFLTTGTFCQPQKFERAVLSGKINEWLKYGFSIHENPCRAEFLNNRKKEIPPYIDLNSFQIHDLVEVFGQQNPLAIYYPFGNIGLDFSEFYFNPTYLRSYSYVYLFSEIACEATFNLETCGGTTIWLNDEFVIDFIPFTRNMVKEKIITLNLEQGLNKLVVCLDDLAERDTDYYFHLIYLGDEKLKMCIPVSADVEIDELNQLEQMLERISFNKEAYISEPVMLTIQNPLETTVDLQIKYKPVADKMNGSERLLKKVEFNLSAEQNELCVFQADNEIPGFYYLQVAAIAQGIIIERKIAVQVFHQKLLVSKTLTIEQRKQEALAYLVEVEVENVYKAAAILATNGDVHRAEQILTEELLGIELRKDCSDFHLVVVLQIYLNYANQLSEQMKKRIVTVLLNFRYWIDEPGDDVMWFFSENHALLFHICQYVAGMLLPDQVFTNSGLTGNQLVQKAELLLAEWFTSFEQEYITEWNSNAYIPVDVLGLCSLYNMTPAGSRWKNAAITSLDRIFYDLSILAHKGAVMTTFGRSYEKELKGNYTAGTTSLLYLAYNKGYLNRASLAFISFILGDYEPPTQYQRFIDLTADQELIYRKTQGYQDYVNLYLYKNADFQLSTAIEFESFRPGYQEHIMQATINPTAQVFINHPGEVQVYGNGRPNFWAGNGSKPCGVQYREMGVLAYHIPADHRIDFTHAYIPLSEFKQYVGDDQIIVLEQDEAYVGVMAAQGIVMQTEGPCRHREFISYGRQNLWLIKMGRKKDFATLHIFYEEMKKISIKQTDEQSWQISGTAYGDVVLGKKGLLINGSKPYQYPVEDKSILQEGDKS